MVVVSFRPLPHDQRNNPTAVANWIKAHIPCPVGGYRNTSQRNRERVFEALQREHVPTAVALEAMRIVFGDPIRVKRPSEIQPTIGKPSKAVDDYAATFSWWDHRFLVAQMNSDLETMNDIIQAVVELLYYLAGGKREEFERARRAMRANARNIGAVVQHLTREELRRLRAAPTPGDFSRLRINPQRGLQSRAARRRAR